MTTPAKPSTVLDIQIQKTALAGSQTVLIQMTLADS
jgi:hypothetical protein